MKFYKIANKSRRFSSVFCSQKWFGMDFLKMAQNGILIFFFFPKMVWNEIPKCSLLKMRLERYSIIWKWFVTEFQGFFSSKKWFGTEFRGFSLPQNRRNSDKTPVCSVLFCILRNNFFVGKWQPQLQPLYSFKETALLFCPPVFFLPILY
jgi:hypothetical protein